MDIVTSFFILLLGYLIGSISFARIIGRLVIPGENLENTTTKIKDTDIEFSFKSVSATTIRARVGSKYGVLTSLLDMAKGAIPVFIIYRSYNSLIYSLIISIGVILGHDFPIYHKFKGGRGVSSLWGSLVILDWTSIPLTAITSMLIGLIIIDDVFIAYLSTPIYLIFWAAFYKGLGPWLIYSLIVNVIYWIALLPEIREYLAFRKTDNYDKARKIRHERYRKRLKEIITSLKG